MADAHLAETDAVCGAFYAIIIGPAGEPVPHSLDIGRDGRRRPVGIAVVGSHAAKVLEFLVLEFHGTFEPIVAVQVHDNAALVEALMALGEIGLDDKTEILLLCLHLEYRRIVIPEMIVGPLPKIGVRSRGDGKGISADGICSRFPGPLKGRKIDPSPVRQCRCDAVGEFSTGGLAGSTST